MIRLFILTSSILLLLSCQKRDWNNPFDSACPKEIWTPTDFKAVQEGTTVKLTWSQPENNISGFKLTKKVDTGTDLDLQNQTKEATHYIDATLTGGRIHSYTITAYAGNNLSNIITVQVTPTFVSTLSTTSITSVKAFAATLSNTISSDGGAPVTAKGICWSTTQNPTISNSKTTDGSGSGVFTSNLTGLSSSTPYYARAYATNSVGTAYGNQVSFTTNYGEVTDVEGNVYQTVKIGNQIWMAENLKTTKYNDGTPIPNVTDNTTWVSLTSGAYCFYNNDPMTYKTTYGALYNWFAINTYKLTPIGWHVASDAEWTTLINYLGGASVAGGKLKEVGNTHWQAPNNGATNESGFTVVPGDARYDNGTFNGIGFSGFGTKAAYWCSNEYDTKSAWYRLLYSSSTVIDKFVNDKLGGYSVRCILGALTIPTVSTTPASILSFSSANSGGNITSDGGAPVISRGTCWSTSPNPTIANNKTIDGTGSGNFTSNLTGLLANTIYYVRAYATTAIGTSYGSETSFILNMNVPGPNITDIEGNVYKTVKIGNQVWMAENLKVAKYYDGSVIPNVTDGAIWPTLTTGAYYWTNNDISAYKNLGALYNWYAVSSSKLAPSGWHLPNMDDYYKLIGYLGGSGIAGGKLREAGLQHWVSPNSGATNESGFNAIPLMPDKTACIMWTNSGTDNGIGWYMYLDVNNSCGIFGNVKWLGYYVRCIKD